MRADQLLTTPQVADRLGTSVRTVYRIIADRLIDAHDIGRGRPKTRVSETALAKYLAAAANKMPSRGRVA